MPTMHYTIFDNRSNSSLYKALPHHDFLRQSGRVDCEVIAHLFLTVADRPCSLRMQLSNARHNMARVMRVAFKDAAQAINSAPDAAQSVLPKSTSDLAQVIPFQKKDSNQVVQNKGGAQIISLPTPAVTPEPEDCRSLREKLQAAVRGVVGAVRKEFSVSPEIVWVTPQETLNNGAKGASAEDSFIPDSHPQYWRGSVVVENLARGAPIGPDDEKFVRTVHAVVRNSDSLWSRISRHARPS